MSFRKKGKNSKSRGCEVQSVRIKLLKEHVAIIKGFLWLLGKDFNLKIPCLRVTKTLRCESSSNNSESFSLF